MSRLLCLTQFIVVMLCITAHANVPQMIHFQGHLTDGSGDPVPDGDYDLTFSIYDDLTDGTLWWTESQIVTTSNGNYDVVLGAVDPIPPGAIADVTEGNENLYRYLEVTVEADSPMSPRIMLMAVPYAVAAERMIGDVTTMPGTLYLYPPSDGVGPVPGATEGLPPIAPYRLQASSNGGTMTIDYPYSVETSGSDSASSFSLSKGLSRRVTMKVDSTNSQVSVQHHSGLNGVLLFADSTKGSLKLNQRSDAYGIELESDPTEIRFEGRLETGVSEKRRWLMRAGHELSAFELYGPNGDPNPGLEVEVDEDSRRFIMSKDALRKALELSMDTAETRLQLLDTSATCENRILLKVDTTKALVRIQSENCSAAGDDLTAIVLQTGIAGAQVGINEANPLHALHVNGNICATGSIGACSDARYKRDIRPIENGLSKLLHLEGVTYNWRTDEFPDKSFTTRRQVGVVAQNVEEVLPEVVLTDSEGFKSVDYARLTALLIEAVKTQQRMIDEQTENIKILQEDMVALREGLIDRAEGTDRIVKTTVTH